MARYTSSLMGQFLEENRRRAALEAQAAMDLANVQRGLGQALGSLSDGARGALGGMRQFVGNGPQASAGLPPIGEPLERGPNLSLRQELQLETDKWLRK